MVEQHFCLRWNNYRTNITAEFETLREGEHFVDVTLACDGQQLKAHKVVLSACSPYFKELLQGNPCTHPIIILRDVAYTHMRSLLEFMYAGEVNISQVHLGAFLHTAEALKIRGLAESSDDRKEHGGLNSMSPLSALKSSLSGLGTMGLGGLGGSILERPLVPQLLPHHTDKPPPHTGPPHHLPQHPHMVPPPLPLPTPTQGCPLPPQHSTSSSTPTTPAMPLGPLPLTVPHTMPDRPPRPPEASERTPSPTPTLPPSKRIRLEKRIHLDTPPCPPLPDKNSHGDSANGNANSGGIVSTAAAANPAALPPDDMAHPVLKTEPVESVTPDNEGVTGWSAHDEGDSSSGGGGGGSEGGGRGGGGGGGSGGETTTPPGPTPPGGTPPDQENTSHLLQAALSSSESHLQGGDGAEEAERPSVCISGEDHQRYDPQRYEVHQLELRAEVRHEPPLDLRDLRGLPTTTLADHPRPELAVAGHGERMAASPPLPPSSLPHSCQLCGKLISCRRNLWKHMERVHFNNPAVRCSLCAKMFKNKYALKDHQRIYHGGLSEPPPPPPPHSASLLSRILQDPRHAQPPQPLDPRHPPMDLQQPPLMPRDPHMRRPMDPHGPPLGRRHHEDDEMGGAGAYPGMGMGSMISQSLAPSMVGVGSPALGAPPRPDWPPQDNPLALVNRAFLSELHQLVTKAD